MAQMDVGLAAGALQADQALAAERAKRGVLQQDWTAAMGGSQQIIAEDVAHHNLLQQVRAEDISGQREQILHAHRVRRDMRAVQSAQIQEEGRQHLIRDEQHRRAEAIHRQQVQQAELQGKRQADFKRVMAASRKREEELLRQAHAQSSQVGDGFHFPMAKPKATPKEEEKRGEAVHDPATFSASPERGGGLTSAPPSKLPAYKPRADVAEVVDPGEAAAILGVKPVAEIPPTGATVLKSEAEPAAGSRYEPQLGKLRIQRYIFHVKLACEGSAHRPTAAGGSPVRNK